MNHIYEVPIFAPHRPTSDLVGRLSLDEPEFEAHRHARLTEAEQFLQECVREAPDPRVAAVTGHLAASGGKRLRLLLALLGAEFGKPWCHGITQAAVIGELVHLASLSHDDVMNAALTRRGAPTANVRWGDRLAVFAGDWLLARAARLAADLGPHAVRLNAVTASRLVAGQLRELAGPAPDEDPVDHYFQVTAGKSAALLAMALGIGALQAEAPSAVVDALTAYGDELGVAFQIADDLLDLTGPRTDTGEERGKDPLAGIPRLPVLLARADDDPGGAELRALLAAGQVIEPEAHRRVLELFRVSSPIAEAEAIMHQRLARARAALDALPPSPARRALDALCDFAALRTS